MLIRTQHSTIAWFFIISSGMSSIVIRAPNFISFLSSVEVSRMRAVFAIASTSDLRLANHRKDAIIFDRDTTC